MSDITARLKEAIAQLALSPHSFAVMANLDPSNFSKMLEGKQKITDRTIGKLCDAHCLSVEWVKHGAGEMKEVKQKVGNIDSPDSIYAEGSEVVIGDAVLRERLKSLQKSVADLRGERKSWDAERKQLKKELEDLRATNNALNAELSKTKDKMIDLLMKCEK